MNKLRLMLSVLCVAPWVAGASTGMYAGKGVTADGSVLIGRTADFSPCNATMFQQICEPGTQVTLGGKANKYRYVCVPMATSLNVGRYVGSAVNEKGVILTVTGTGATKAKALENDPFVCEKNGGVGESKLADYMIGNAATAHEAVELLTGAIRTFGHDGAKIYMVADENEAWYVEVYTGHEWAVVKMPEDKAAVFGDHFNLRGLDPNDTENAMHSPLFFEPGHKIAPTNMFELMRARHEDMADGDIPTMRTNAAIRVIGTAKQGGCQVLQLDCRETTPENMRGTVWSCLGAAEYGVFHPINASQNHLPEAYANDAHRTFGYDPNRAADAFRRLSALAQSNRKWYGPGVRNYWRAQEERMAVEWSRKLDEAIVSGDSAALSAYTFDEETHSLMVAKRMYDELLWYAAANNRIAGDGCEATDEPVEPFKPSETEKEVR